MTKSTAVLRLLCLAIVAFMLAQSAAAQVVQNVGDNGAVDWT